MELALKKMQGKTERRKQFQLGSRVEIWEERMLREKKFLESRSSFWLQNLSEIKENESKICPFEVLVHVRAD